MVWLFFFFLSVARPFPRFEFKELCVLRFHEMDRRERQAEMLSSEAVRAPY